MLDKQVYELTINDLACCGVWFFPMDESVEDELTVRPLLDMECCTDFQLIVRASFEGGNGYRYSGYLYWDGSGKVEYLKPVVLLEDDTAVSFSKWGLIYVRQAKLGRLGIDGVSRHEMA